MIPLLLSEIHRRGGSAVFYRGKLTGVTVGQQTVARFYEGKPVFSDGTAHDDIFFADGEGLVVERLHDLWDGIALVGEHHIFHAPKRQERLTAVGREEFR